METGAVSVLVVDDEPSLAALPRQPRARRVQRARGEHRRRGQADPRQQADRGRHPGRPRRHRRRPAAPRGLRAQDSDTRVLMLTGTADIATSNLDAADRVMAKPSIPPSWSRPSASWPELTSPPTRMEIPLHEHDHDPEARGVRRRAPEVPFERSEKAARSASAKETSEQAAIVAKYASLFSRDQLDALREAEAAASGEERERLYRLRKTCEGRHRRRRARRAGGRARERDPRRPGHLGRRRAAAPRRPGRSSPSCPSTGNVRSSARCRRRSRRSSTTTGWS